VTVVLLASDSDHVFAEVDATLATDDCEVLRVRTGPEVLPVIEAKKPDLVILDMQIGSMGGIATCIAIRQEEGADRIDIVAVALLLDREADVFLAQQADADGWLIKPLDSLRLRKLSKQLLAGEDYYEGVVAEAPAPGDADEVSAGAES
jgi:CheY-like chemotaxis protein